VVQSLPEKVLVISPEGIGESVLSLPGLQILRQENPDVEITVMAEAELEGFWRMSPAVDFFQPLEKDRPMLGKLKYTHFDRAYLLRDGFRAALICWRAGIPRRIGFRGNWRRLLLTEIVHRPEGHRQFEFMNILGVQGEPPAPEIAVPHDGFHTLERKLTHFPNIGKKLPVIFQALEEERPMGARPILMLIPGGAKERWPVEHFGSLAKNLASSLNALVLLSGDAAVCAEVAAAAGADRVVNLSGQTMIPEWAALLAVSDCVVSNAGGGAQLAAAIGTPVLVVQGPVDPAKTAPLGECVLLEQESNPVTTDRAYGAVLKVLER
jgi:heptosyltransferase-2